MRDRPRALTALFSLLLLSGCGYVGDPLPPALRIPMPVTSLTAIQQGNQILIRFVVPPDTTEGLPIKSLQIPEVLVGDALKWPESAVNAAVQGDPAEPVQVTIRAAPEWYGKLVTVGVRSIGDRERASEWAKINLHVAAPLDVPSAVKAENVPEGVKVSWRPVPGAKSYRILRDPERNEPGQSDKDYWIDTATSYGKTFTYKVIALAANVESEPSAPAQVGTEDTFAPAVPSGLLAATGPSNIELTWDPNPEGDFKLYRIYRAEEGEPARIAETNTPSFADRDASRGHSYRYWITAVDQIGNESARSEPVAASLPK